DAAPALGDAPAVEAADDVPAAAGGASAEDAAAVAAPDEPAAGRSGLTMSMYEAPAEPASPSTPTAAVHFELSSVGSPKYRLGPWRSSTTMPCAAFDVTPPTWESNWSGAAPRTDTALSTPRSLRRRP